MKELWLLDVLEADFLVSMPRSRPTTGRRHSQHEEHVWYRAGRETDGRRTSPLEGHSGKILDLCATVRSLRYRGRDRGDGRKRATQRQRSSAGKIVLADDPVAADATCAL